MEDKRHLIGALDIENPDFHAKLVALLGYKPKHLNVYGNLSLLNRPGRFYVPESLGSPKCASVPELNQLEADVECGVLANGTLVSGIAGCKGQRAAIVPLRWGAPRILVLNCGIDTVLGHDLRNELFRAARLWRYEFNPSTDLVVSNAPNGTGFVAWSSTVDKIVVALASIA